jgi:hypothetical protein
MTVVDESREIAKAQAAYWQQYDIPSDSEVKTESQAIWRDFLISRRTAYNMLCNEPPPRSLAVG